MHLELGMGERKDLGMEIWGRGWEFGDVEEFVVGERGGGVSSS